MRQGWQSCVFTRIWDIPARSCCVALCELAERIRLRSELRVNSSATFARRTNLRKVTCLKGWHTCTELNQGVGEDLFVLADSNEQVFELLNIVDLATRFNNCFPVPSKRPDDVLSVLEMVWINWAGPMSHLISDMGGEFQGELGELKEAHGIRQYFTTSEARWQNGLVERNGGIWKAVARKAIQDVGPHGFVEMRRLACMVRWAKHARIYSSGYSPAQWVIGRGYKLPWSLLDEKQSAELASLELPNHSPELGRRMSWLWAAGRAFETLDASHRLERALSTGVRARSHTHRIVNVELAYVSRRVKKKQNRRADGTCCPSVVWSSHCCWQREEQCVCVYGGRLTKVAPECLQKASVAGQMSWDITTKKKALFEMALSWEKPLLDESGEFVDSEMLDTVAGSPKLEEVNSPVNDDCVPPISEPSMAEKEDHSEDEALSLSLHRSQIGVQRPESK